MMQGQYQMHRLCLDIDGVGKYCRRQCIREAHDGRTGGHDGVHFTKRTIIIVIVVRQAGVVSGHCFRGVDRMRGKYRDALAMLMHVRNFPDNRIKQVRYQEKYQPDCRKLSTHGSDLTHWSLT